MKGIPERAVLALRLAGLLPESVQQFSDGDLLRPLLRVQEQPSATAAGRLRFAKLTTQASPKARLAFGFRDCNPGLATWLGDRFVWWPQGVPRGRFVGLVSSRLPRRLDTLPLWFTALRAACLELDPKHHVLLCAASTSTARFVQRAALHFRLPVVVIHEPRTTSLRGWFQRLAGTEYQTPKSGISEAFVSPLLSDRATLFELVRDTPLRDRLVVALSEDLFVLRLRRNGHSQRLIRARVLEQQDSPGTVRIAQGEQLVSPETATELAAIGASIWHPNGATGACGTSPEVASFPKPAPLTALPARSIERGPPERSSSIISVCTSIGRDYLTHCTRGPQGAWPDQTEDAFIDELIFDPGNIDRSPWASLCRIVDQQRIVASYRTAACDRATVCFTEVPLEELSALRIFRPHRGRWDFEPYGIAIRRSWLVERRARAVRYCDEQPADCVSEDDRPFLQPQASRSPKGRSIDWRVEREWRHLGDVDLSELPSTAGLLFVPTQHEAQRLTSFSRWPVAVLATLTQ